MSGLDYHAVQCGALAGWHNLEDTITIIRYHPLCSQYEPHEGAALGRHRPHTTIHWGCL